jgi:hypothetical protein
MSVRLSLEVLNSSNVSLQSVSIQLAAVEGCCVGDPACVACNDSFLESNEVWVDDGTSSCTRECGSAFIRVNESCVPFILRACGNGFYPSGHDACEVCAVPDKDELGGTFNWSTPGVLYDATSCGYVCMAGYFTDSEAPLCSTCTTDISCSPNWYAVACSTQNDARCEICSQCELGQTVQQACTASSDTVCAACSAALPTGGTWLPDCGFTCGLQLTLNTTSNACIVCDPACAFGMYKTISDDGEAWCDASTAFTGCAPCAIPANAHALSSGFEFAHSCYWACLEDLVYNFNDSCVPVVESTVPIELPCDIDECWTLGEMVNSSIQPCICAPCAAKPNGTMTVWNSLNSCEWYCVYPFNKNDGVCQEIRFLHRPAATVYERTTVKTSLLMTLLSAFPLVMISVCMVQFMCTS